MPSFDLLVERLEETSAIVRIDGNLYRLAIGQSLAEAMPANE